MKLFEAGRIGKLQTKNRIVMAPMGGGGYAEPNGRISSQSIDYYVARAKGGVGLIIAGAVYVENEIENHLVDGLWARYPAMDKALYVSRWSMLADAVHDYGTKLAIQLSAGFGRCLLPHITSLHAAVAPSSLPCFRDPNVIARELTTEEIGKLAKAFGLAARLVRVAGIDAIELHAHGGYLMDQFQTALWNKRKDKYGGDIDGRLRFSLEVIANIRAAVGEDFPIIYRYGIKHYTEGGRGVEESQEMAQRLERAGVNALHVDAGCYESRHWMIPPTYQPPGCLVDMAEAVKKVVTIPVIAVGKLGYPELSERVLSEGKADFIALGRALLADPEWPNKVKEGRLDDIRPCIGCDECLARGRSNKYLSCAVNPTTGMEREFALRPTENHKSVLVIGGGPAGMEAALVAASRGHQVTLWEKSDRLGGNLIPASVPDFKKDLRSLLDYLSTQIRKLGVDIRLGRAATPEMVKQMMPQVLIIATGASPIIPEILGVNKSIVATATDILLDSRDVGETIVVRGGGPQACEVAAFLAGKSRRVALVTRMGCLVPDWDPDSPNRSQLLEMLSQGNVEILTNTTVSEITDDGVIINNIKSGEKRELRADRVVLAVGLKSQDSLQQALLDKVAELHAIGACVQPGGKIIGAMWDGFRCARLI